LFHVKRLIETAPAVRERPTRNAVTGLRRGIEKAAEPVHEIEDELRVLRRHRSVHPHGGTALAIDLGTEHRRLSEDSDANLAVMQDRALRHAVRAEARGGIRELPGTLGE
jgi:hypothetical protein